MSIDQLPQLKQGDKVRYCPQHGREEKGMVKSVNSDGDTAFVVYKCNEEWSRFMEYTGCATNVTDLKIGWNA